MRKSIIATTAAVAALTLVIGDRGIPFGKESGPDIESARNAETVTEPQNGMIVIEEERVPLAAGIDEAAEGNVEEVSKETPANESEEQMSAGTEEKTVEVPSCLIDGEHNTVWTDLGDYRVLKCADCKQEIGNRAEIIADGVYGYYDDAAAALLFSRVNDMRTGCILSDDLGDIASQRALEYAKNTDPGKMRTKAECIAIGQGDADSALAVWSGSDSYSNYLIDPVYTEGGCACLWYDAGEGKLQPIWILALN